MVTWIKTVLTLLIIYNVGFLVAYAGTKPPVSFWRDFFSVRNILGWIYGLVLAILSTPAVIVYYVFYWIMVLVTWLDIFGTKKSFRMAKFSPSTNEEDEE